MIRPPMPMFAAITSKPRASGDDPSRAHAVMKHAM